MTTPTLVVLLLTVPVTLLALALAGRWVGKRVSAAYREALAAYERLEHVLDRLRRDGEVSRRELERIEARRAQLATARDRRRSGEPRETGTAGPSSRGQG